MSPSIEDRLLAAIKKDDLKAFDAVSESENPGEYRLGRFPVLSLLYLFGAKKIVKAHEAQYVKISAWEPLFEPASVSELFAKKAGKCLRLYMNEVVTPLEMLLILDKTKQVKALYPIVRLPEGARDRLKAIYSIKYHLKLSFKGNGVVMDRRPMSRREKKRLITVCVCIALIVVIAIATPLTVTALVPKRVEGGVTSFAQIDLTSKEEYVLTRDISIPENFSAEQVNCTIDGGGKKLIVGKGANLGTLSGKLQNATVQTFGTPLFNVVTNVAEIKNVTFEVEADVSCDDDSAFVTLRNCGTIDGVTLNVKGKLSAFGELEGNEDGKYFGGIAAVNDSNRDSPRYYGEIKNCSVNYDGFKLVGETSSNAMFGGIVGVNNSYLYDSEVTGSVIADTFDIGGICAQNAYYLSGLTVSATLDQTSTDPQWTPTIGGIVAQNDNLVQNSKNVGKISATGADTAVVGGIAASSTASINGCVATCPIDVNAKTAIIGGIMARSLIERIGLTLYIGFVDRCVSECDISATLTATDGEKSNIGGIVGMMQQAAFTQNVIGENGEPLTETIYWGGGVTNSIFIGAFEGNVDYTGNLVGACGAEVYEANSYVSGGFTARNFEGNYCVKNGLRAFAKAYSATANAYVDVLDKEVSSLTEAAIEATELYRTILTEVGM